ncbi:MAG: hypothetical protein LAO55_18775 [Acidobacteriia bacterium]|nr:hypothetical protein [Terriglobia bacterium]
MRSHVALIWMLVLIGCVSQREANAENVIAPFSGKLFLKCIGGSAGATSQFGMGTSPVDFVPYLSNLPSSCPTAEVPAGTVSAGQAVSFGIRTTWSGQTYWAFTSGIDQASKVAFGSKGGSVINIIEQTSSSTWVMHLDDAASYLVDDNDSDILIQLRLETPSGATTTLDFETPFPQALQPMNSYINGTPVSSGARITNQYQNVVMSGAALAAFGQGHATSGIYGIAPIGTNSTIDYRAPITFTFAGSTDYFSISGDRAGNSGNTVVLSAYGAGGLLITSVSYVETSNGQKFELTGIGPFQSVTVQMVTGNPATSGIGFDLVTVGALTSGSSTLQQVLPQFAFGGGWYSALYFTNTGTSAVSFPVNFIGDNGAPMIVPSVGGSSVTVNLAPRGTVMIEAPNAGPLTQGYASVLLPSGVSGYGVFRLSAPQRADQEAVVPLAGAASTMSTMVWDDTGFTTAAAIVNLSSVSSTIVVTARDSLGTVIGTSAVFLPGNGKAAGALRDLPGLAAMAGSRGSADFNALTGNVAVLGLRFDGAAFTSIPTVQR